MFRSLALLFFAVTALAEDAHAPTLSDSQLKPYLLKQVLFNAAIANNNAAQANLLKAQIAAKDAADKMNAAQAAAFKERQTLESLCGDYELDTSEDEPRCGKPKTKPNEDAK